MEIEVEQCAKLQSLNRMLEDCILSGRKVALVTGPGGAGKTTLLAKLSECAKNFDALVVNASGARSEKDHPLGLLGQMFRSFTLSTEREAQLERILAARDVDFQNSLSSAGTVDELIEILLEVAGGRPMVLTVDDIQYADPDSIQALFMLLRRLVSYPVAAVFAEWRTSSAHPPLALAECIKQPYFYLLNLEPLSLGNVTEWMRQQNPDGVDVEQLAPSFLAATGGNPLLLQALFQDHFRRLGEPDSEAVQPVPDGVDAASGADESAVGTHFKVAVEVCLHRWEPQLRAVARGLAVLGGPTPASVLARLLGLEQRAVVEALSALTEAGLLRAGWFRHPASRAAALSGLGERELAALNERAALQLHVDGAGPSKVAERLVVAGGVPEQLSVDLLRDAAWQAVGEGNPTRAAEFLEVARRACSDAQERAEVTGMLARVLWLVKPSAVASLLVPLNAALEDGSLDDRNTVLLSTFLAWQGRADNAATVLEHVDPEQYEFHVAGTAELTLARQWLHWVSPLTGTGRTEGINPAHGAEEAGGCRSWSDLVKSAEQVLQCCRIADALPPVVLCALLALVYDNRLDDAQRWCETLRTEAESHQAAAWVAVLAAVQGLLAVRRGDLFDAELQSRAALTAMPRHNWGAVLGLPLSCLVHAATAIGDLGEARTIIRQAPPVVPQNLFWLHFLHARGRFYIGDNRSYAALADLQTCGRFLASGDLDLPHVVSWRGDLAEVWLRLNDPGNAKAVLEKHLTLTGIDDKREHGRALRILAATVDLPDRAVMLSDAVQALQDSGDRLELALALADTSDAELESGRFAESRLKAQQAKQLAKICGAEPLYWRLQNHGEEQNDVLTDRKEHPGIALLSEAERKVAILAAQGRSNREISRTLFITVSTVEQHLTRVYRKLRVNSRSGLPMELSLVGTEGV
ncbi:LuxR C-terminal-related transcriptional regulator [Streptomyces sp. NPDC091377]|uniref:LuxR C-terminal-related transcriptional regulator n=1 Tax=Streptomyces sp. NPDC091377 TaxID=3365995 RepID=UPI0038087604